MKWCAGKCKVEVAKLLVGRAADPHPPTHNLSSSSSFLLLLPLFFFIDLQPLHTAGKCKVEVAKLLVGRAAEAKEGLPPGWRRVNPTHYTLHPTLYTLHLTPYTLNPSSLSECLGLVASPSPSLPLSLSPPVPPSTHRPTHTVP